MSKHYLKHMPYPASLLVYLSDYVETSVANVSCRKYIGPFTSSDCLLSLSTALLHVI